MFANFTELLVTVLAAAIGGAFVSVGSFLRDGALARWQVRKLKENSGVLRDMQKSTQDSQDVLRDIQAEVKNNHGSSMRDSVDRQETKLDAALGQLAKVSEVTTGLKTTVELMRLKIDAIDDRSKSTAHQVGETRRSADVTHEAMNHAIDDMREDHKLLVREQQKLSNRLDDLAEK